MQLFLMVDHTQNVFKGITTGEIKRVKRLNEIKKDFKKS